MRRLALLLRPSRLFTAATLAGALTLSASLALAADQPTMGSRRRVRGTSRTGRRKEVGDAHLIG